MIAIQQLYNMVGKNENILWSGRPQFKCFILESIFNPLLPFALVWALFDGLIFLGVVNGITQNNDLPRFLIIPVLSFLILHLMPVWIYLGGVLLAYFRYKNASFLVTDKGIYTSSGLFSLKFNHKPFAEIAHVTIHRGIIDRLLGVGDVNIGNAINTESISDTTSPKMGREFSFYDIPDYQQVYSLVKELQLNIYADVQYPNDLRPNQNHGYNTAYIPPERKL